MSTAHINAQKGDFAKTVFMPGDPLRSKFIATEFFESAELVNDVRGVQGYTGYYKGRRVSVMASGMGAPSMSIYAHELYSFFGVEEIIRIGTAGAVADLKVRDVILAQAACSNTDFAREFGLKGTYSPIADFGLLVRACGAALSLSKKILVGNIYSTDFFYSDLQSLLKYKDMGVLAVEMETSALYACAAKCGKKALSILTVSDIPATNESLPASERETSFRDMMEIALETALQQAF